MYRLLHEIITYNFKSVVTAACGVGAREKLGADSGGCTHKTASKHQNKKVLKQINANTSWLQGSEAESVVVTEWIFKVVSSTDTDEQCSSSLSGACFWFQ